MAGELPKEGKGQLSQFVNVQAGFSGTVEVNNSTVTELTLGKARTRLIIQNPSTATESIFIGFNNSVTASVGANLGLEIAAGTGFFYEITGSSEFQVFAISPSATFSVVVQELY